VFRSETHAPHWGTGTRPGSRIKATWARTADCTCTRVRPSILLLASLLPALAADPFTAQVVRVTDGDTIVVEASGHVVKVRLFGIDCPESKQEGGTQATWFTRDAALDRTVTVISQDTDRYGPMVAEIVLPDGRVVNKEFVHSAVTRGGTSSMTAMTGSYGRWNRTPGNTTGACGPRPIRWPRGSGAS
jgi:endonuclease YncB( thermonuclease family)